MFYFLSKTQIFSNTVNSFMPMQALEVIQLPVTCNVKGTFDLGTPKITLYISLLYNLSGGNATLHLIVFVYEDTLLCTVAYLSHVISGA